MISSFFARPADLTPSALAIANSWSRSFASSADCSRAPLATNAYFQGNNYLPPNLPLILKMQVHRSDCFEMCLPRNGGDLLGNPSKPTLADYLLVGNNSFCEKI
jgi:hypothetical protein